MSHKPTYEELEKKVKKLEKKIQVLEQVEKGLRESEQRYRVMVENANESIAVMQDGVIKYANPKVVERSGYTLDRIASMSFLDFIHPDDRPLAIDRYHKRMRGESVSDGAVYKLIDRDGETYWHYASMVDVTWEGKPALVVLMMDITEIKKSEEALKNAHDNLDRQVKERTADLEKANEQLRQEIEERRKAEVALRESEEHLTTSQGTFETVLDHLDAAVFVSDLQNWEVLFVNKSAREIFGAVAGNLCWQVFQKGQTGPCLFCQNYKLLDEQGIPTGVNLWEMYSNTTDRWYEVRACAVYWVDGHLVRLSVATDITQRKQSEEVLKGREKELKEKTRNLEEVNTALKVLLKRREKDKIEVEENVLLNVRELVEPYLEKLIHSGLLEHQQTLASILESNLQDIISPFIHRLSSKYLNLTPSEVQVASLIKQGKNTKQIAELLNLSTRTIKFHRENIRKKMGITNSRANLRTHLISLR